MSCYMKKEVQGKYAIGKENKFIMNIVYKELLYKLNADIILQEFNRHVKEELYLDVTYQDISNVKKIPVINKKNIFYGSYIPFKYTQSNFSNEIEMLNHYYNINENFYISFMQTNPGGTIPWHTDDKNKIKSSINFVLKNKTEYAKLWYEDQTINYKLAALDILKKHAVLENEETRIVLRICYTNLSFFELYHKIEKYDKR